MMWRFLRYFLLVSFFSSAQPGKFIWPIDSPRVITGNYGELRPNHFHAGIDFSTNGNVNLQVYAAEEGYVSRIRVSPVGYGKSVYITHPNGLVTVYGHLNSFSLKIDNVVKKEQYDRQSYEVELLQRPNFMTVRKNEIIGLSGNTGGSTGPHLHFEIRDAVTETPLNPLLFFSVPDSMPPEVHGLGVYNLSDTMLPKFIRSYKLSNQPDTGIAAAITVSSSIVGLAFSASDRLLPKGNPNNVYSAKLYFDNALIYSHELKGIDFEDSRFVNEFSETKERLKFQKCFVPSVYPPKLYSKSICKGRIVLTDTLFHSLKLELADERGNTRTVNSSVRTTRLNDYLPPAITSSISVKCDSDFIMRKEGLFIFIPARTLFYNTPLIIENTLETTGKLIVLPGDVNMRTAATLGFKTPARYAASRNKLVIRSGNSVVVPVHRNDSVFFNVKNLGWFQLGADSAAPVITTQLKHKKIKRMKNFREFSFVITDRASGLSKYSLFVNDKWVLAEYDAKNDLLTYVFDDSTPAGPLNFRVEASDKCGNYSAFEFKLSHR